LFHRRTVTTGLRFLVFRRDLPVNPLLWVNNVLHVFLNMHIRSEYHWTPFSGCIHIQFEFMRCFGSLCYSTDIWLWIIVSSRFQPHNTIVTLVSSTLWGNQLNQSLAGWPTFWKSILRVARGNAFVYFMRRPIRWSPYYPTYDDEALLR